LFTLILARTELRVCGSVHLPAELNTSCDRLSRRDENGRYREVEEVIPGARNFKMDKDPLVEEALRLCNPMHGILEEDSFNEFWERAGRLVADVARVSQLRGAMDGSS
jgi:hypothetical protein